MTKKNALLRAAFRAYPFKKGQYRLMLFLERGLDRGEAVVPAFGTHRLWLDVSEHGLQSSFYFFMPERYEADTQRWLKSHLRPGMTAMDVGAHVGVLSVFMAGLVGSAGRVFSFEPSSRNFARLEKNLSGNGLAHARAVRAAVGAEEGEARLVLHSTSSGHALEASGLTGDGSETVPVVTLDAFLDREKARPDVLKIDAERSELFVVAGARKTLSGPKAPCVVCEVPASRKGGDAVRQAFYSFGYKSYVLNPALARRAYLAELPPTEPVLGLQNLLFKK